MGGIKNIVIIGNGPAGNAAASIIRRYYGNLDISIFSEECYTQYSPCFLHEYISGVLDRNSLFLKVMQDYEHEGINIFLGKSVYEINSSKKYIVYEGGTKYYDRLILSTGSEAIIPEIAGSNLKGVFKFKNLKDAEYICEYIFKSEAKTALVVGAGPIGVELSIALRIKGLKVYLVEKEGWILSRTFEEDLAKKLEMKIQSNGIEVLTGVEIRKILGKNKLKSVQLSNDRMIDCDIIVFSIGMRPKTDIAKKAGVELGHLGGIITDEKMVTNIPSIYACGDCIEIKDTLTNKNVVSALWPNAVIEGKVAGLNAIGVSKKMSSQTNLNCIKIFDLYAASLGYTSNSLYGSKGKNIIEGHVYRGEYRIVLFDRNLVGIQIIGNNNILPVFNLMYQKEKWSVRNDALKSDELIRKIPFYFLFLNINTFLKKRLGPYT